MIVESRSSTAAASKEAGAAGQSSSVCENRKRSFLLYTTCPLWSRMVPVNTVPPQQV